MYFQPQLARLYFRPVTRPRLALLGSTCHRGQVCRRLHTPTSKLLLLSSKPESAWRLGDWPIGQCPCRQGFPPDECTRSLRRRASDTLSLRDWAPAESGQSRPCGLHRPPQGWCSCGARRTSATYRPIPASPNSSLLGMVVSPQESRKNVLCVQLLMPVICNYII